MTNVQVELHAGPLPAVAPMCLAEGAGAVLCFEGRVRPLEDGAPIIALDYDVYEPMARKMLRQIGQQLAGRHELTGLCVEHSIGRVSVGQCSFKLQIASPHRQEALAAMAEFIDRLKQDVPIWKTPVAAGEAQINGPASVAELSHVDAAGRVKMVDVGAKEVTSRRAVAEGRVSVSPELAAKIQANTLAKGNLLEVARLAAIQAAKRTGELIPLAHSLTLDHIHAEAWLDGCYVHLRAAISTAAKTGVEMEALVAVSLGALAVIDMGKAVDPAMVVENVHLVEKTGGSHGDFHAAEFATEGEALMTTPITVAVLTISDRCWRGEAEDTSGPALVDLARQRLQANLVAAACVPDDRAQIAAQLRAWALDAPEPDLILTTGGTGLGPRDVTPEATAEVLQRRHPALQELVRLRCLAASPRVFLSRGEAGTLGRSLVINLPGSRRGATECFLALADVLPHALDMIRGQGHEIPSPFGRGSG